MTKETIMIDGVDISECKNFSCGVCEEENKIPRTINHFTADCRMYPNCYYKQLKRKEQECEELKERLHQCWKVENSFVEQIDQLEADNKDLKKDYTTAKSMYDLCQSDFMELAKIKDNYKQALQEIKDYCDRYPQNSIGFKQQILQKCEVLDEQNS